MTKLNTLKSAIGWQANAAKNNCWLVIMHGDDGKFWLVSGKQAQALEAQGYERA